MQRIEAVIGQDRMSGVRDALEGIGVDDFMETAIHCHRRGMTMSFRGATFVANVMEKVKLEIIAADEAVARIVAVIGASARSDRPEECRIAVRPYLEVT